MIPVPEREGPVQSVQNALNLCARRFVKKAAMLAVQLPSLHRSCGPLRGLLASADPKLLPAGSCLLQPRLALNHFILACLGIFNGRPKLPGSVISGLDIILDRLRLALPFALPVAPEGADQIGRLTFRQPMVGGIALLPQIPELSPRCRPICPVHKRSFGAALMASYLLYNTYLRRWQACFFSSAAS